MNILYLVMGAQVAHRPPSDVMHSMYHCIYMSEQATHVTQVNCQDLLGHEVQLAWLATLMIRIQPNTAKPSRCQYH